ncbi:right-handed parallel beta-helix repeat-containing protein [Thermodesulfobacteriota bacterium]
MPNVRRPIVLTALPILLIVMLSVVDAAEYHVAVQNPTASDRNRGSLEQPWKSISKANKTVKPGDVVHIHAGVYRERIEPLADGKDSAPIIYAAFAGDDVQLGENPEHKACINLRGRSFIRVKGIKITDPGNNYPAYARMVGAQHCVLEDCDFSGAVKYYHGVLIGNELPGRSSSYNTLRNVTLKGVPGDIILIRGDAHHNLFVRCYLSDIGASKSHAMVMIHGLRPKGKVPHHNAFIDCEISPVHHSGVDMAGGTHHNLFDRCVFRNAAPDGNAVQMPVSDNIFRRCLVINNRGHQGGANNTFSMYTARDQWFEEGGYFTYSTAVRNHIYNNTFTGNLGFAISCDYWPSAEHSFPLRIGDNKFVNNVFAFNGTRRGGLEIFYNEGTGKISGDVWSHNLLGADGRAQVMSWGGMNYTLLDCLRRIVEITFAANIQEDPLFKDRKSGDYGLQDGSPCIDAGGALTHTTSAGEGTSIPVLDSGFFCDGFGIIDGDMVVVAGNPPVKVVKIPDATHLVVEKAISWKAADPVSLPYSGNAPDIGAVEYKSKGQRSEEDGR